MTWYNRTIERYIVSLLDMFNDMKMPIYNQDGVLIKEIPVPIYFGNSDKAYKLHNTTENLVNGNNFTLPRMSLTFNSMTRNAARDTNKYSYINVTDPIDNKKVQFQFNSVAYDFSFNLQLQTRTLSDALILMEHITPLFRPTYTIPVFEIPIQEEPTSIIVELQSVDMDIPTDFEEDDIRIITINMPLLLRGNVYLPIKDQALITKMRLYINEKIDNDFYNSLLFYNWDAVNIEVDEKDDRKVKYDRAEYRTENTKAIDKIKEFEGDKGW